jgi:nucleotide-binding universal stress UspA family protein
MRLLIGLARREGGKDALELARALCAGQRAKVLVVTVLYSEPWVHEYGRLSGDAAGDAGPYFDLARNELEGIHLETRAYGGSSPAAVLTALAEEEDFDAIVVGSPHRGRIGRVLAGSTAINLLNGAPTDVAVAPRGFAENRHEALRRIAVAYDGTPESTLALRRAETLAKPAKAALEVITVVQPSVAVPAMMPGAYVPDLPPQPDEVIGNALDSVDPSLAAETRRLDGDPAEELVRACEEGVDLLVVGSRGYGPLTRVLLGSVSRKLACEAPCPVLVVRRP